MALFFKMWCKRSLTQSHMSTHTAMQSCVGKLTHRTCRATAPSVLSLCVNRSVGNSCRAGRHRHIWLEGFTHGTVCERGDMYSTSTKNPLNSCTDKEPLPREFHSQSARLQSNRAPPRTVREHASSESDEKRIGK